MAAPLLQALAADKYDTPTPIQEQAIPPVLAGRDLLGIAQTGTGKTAAFALPILHRLAESGGRAAPRSCRALILSPTRELASQIAESTRRYGRNLRLSVATVYGGVAAGPQTKRLASGVDVLVATPGRLMDHLSMRTLRLDAVECFVLDEADQMLDLGFMKAIRKIVPLLPRARQNLFFSATMPDAIDTLAKELLHMPVTVAVTPVATTVERVEQRVLLVNSVDKRALLSELLTDPIFSRTLVFTRTKHGADRVVRQLESDGIAADAIHGNKSQSQRERALARFRSGAARILVATDIAARGIDVPEVSHVVNFDLPNIPESYVHRIGRTARAGAGGMAISFCDETERSFLRGIEALIRQRLPSEDRRRNRPAERSGGEDSQARGLDGRGSRSGHGAGHGTGQGKPRVAGRGQEGRRPDHRAAVVARPAGEPGRDQARGDARENMAGVTFLRRPRDEGAVAAAPNASGKPAFRGPKPHGGGRDAAGAGKPAGAHRGGRKPRQGGGKGGSAGPMVAAR